MEVYNRMTTQVLAFPLPFDLEIIQLRSVVSSILPSSEKIGSLVSYIILVHIVIEWGN